MGGVGGGGRDRQTGRQIDRYIEREGKIRMGGKGRRATRKKY